jgi:phosphate transport system permease protein
MTSPISAADLKATGRSRRRLLKNKVFEVVAVLSAVAAIAVLGIVVWSVFIRGVKALDLNFFTKGPAVFGQSGGGIAPALVGTLLLVAIATAMALPMG